MKHLGIDYGTKRIGIAISDESGSFAFPKKIIANNKQGIIEILEIISQEKIKKIIIGNSLNQKGEKNSLMKDIEKFIFELEKNTNVPVEMQDERFSSVFAKSFDFEKSDFNNANLKSSTKNKSSSPDHIDDRAAAMMLQRYLDKQK